MNYKDYTLGDWIGYISGVIEDETTLDGNEMRDLVEFLATMQEPMTDYKSFCEWVASEVIDEENWEWNSGSFPEAACRKLNKLGVVDTDGKRWIYENESIEQKLKAGHWIDTGSGQQCSECGEIQYGYDNMRFYCANCGSYNGGGEKDADSN